MASAHSMSKIGAGRNRSSKRAGAPSRKRLARQDQESPQPSGDGTRFRGRLREFLELEQGFLLKMQSLLLCIVQSIDDSAHPSTGPYYPTSLDWRLSWRGGAPHH